ncbi:MAG: hypothetical protein GEV05_28280 [Betaproteobacteria bacterium]|nr:hypothetical protein [Betaproteobacteria bacterium]
MRTRSKRKATRNKPARGPKVKTPIAPEFKCGWPLFEYLGIVGFGKSLYYELPEPLRPESILIGRKRVVIEPPPVYLRRLADAQKAA